MPNLFNLNFHTVKLLRFFLENFATMLSYYRATQYDASFVGIFNNFSLFFIVHYQFGENALKKLN